MRDGRSVGAWVEVFAMCEEQSVYEFFYPSWGFSLATVFLVRVGCNVRNERDLCYQFPLNLCDRVLAGAELAA